MQNGYIKVEASTVECAVADTEFNTQKIIEKINEANGKKVKVLVFPELCITTYTCGDLFYDDRLLESAKESLKEIAKATENTKTFIAVGMPLKIDGGIYNVAVAINNGEILGFVPKTYLPNYAEFYEKRVFTPAPKENKEIVFDGKSYPFGNKLIFSCCEMVDLKIGIEICEDAFVPTPPSTNYCLNGATVILNLSASNEVVGKKQYRNNAISDLSSRNLCGYVYANAGNGESTTDLVFAGHNLIYENGKKLAESELFSNESIISEIDVKKLNFDRSKKFNYCFEKSEVKEIPFHLGVEKTELTRKYNKTPFVPQDEKTRKERAELILNLQTNALAKRFTHTHSKSMVIGLSGGLDSTLALLVAVRVADLTKTDRKNIVAVTMPCFGTTDRTFDNSCDLAKACGVTLKKVDIKKAVLRHFKDIKHDEKVKDVTYENSQARERTQVLMDIANQIGGLVVGTGDLSETALGWSTYNGDHMSMYGVNCSVPKTLIRYLVRYEADNGKPKLKKILYDILDTPVSPELLPPSDGKIAQKTEDIVGPYVLHDFFLYYYIRHGFTPQKLYDIAVYTFKGEYTEEEIDKWLKNFYKRFFTQQFKRSCVPDGVKVGTVSLSPRGDWRMPSDAVSKLWVH